MSLKKPEARHLFFGKKECIVQYGKIFYKLRAFKETDGKGGFGKDLDILQKEYHICLLREAE